MSKPRHGKSHQGAVFATAKQLRSEAIGLNVNVACAFAFDLGMNEAKRARENALVEADRWLEQGEHLAEVSDKALTGELMRREEGAGCELASTLVARLTDERLRAECRRRGWYPEMGLAPRYDPPLTVPNGIDFDPASVTTGVQQSMWFVDWNHDAGVEAREVPLTATEVVMREQQALQPLLDRTQAILDRNLGVFGLQRAVEGEQQAQRERLCVRDECFSPPAPTSDYCVRHMEEHDQRAGLPPGVFIGPRGNPMVRITGVETGTSGTDGGPRPVPPGRVPHPQMRTQCIHRLPFRGRCEACEAGDNAPHPSDVTR